MSRFKIISLILLPGLLLCRGLAYSAEPSYEVITTDIASTTENRIVLLDKLGFIWVGTESGINVYDSNGRNVLDPERGAMRELEGVSVSSLYESHGDRIWIGGDKGLYIYDEQKNHVEKFSVKTKYGVSISSRVSSILEVPDGNIWIATEGQGIFIYNPSAKTLTQDSRHGSFYFGLAASSDGLIYAIRMNGVLQSYRQDGKLVKEYTLPDYSGEKNSFFLAASGRDIWIASGSHLYRLDTSSGTISVISTPGLRGAINTLLARQDGTLLVSTDAGVWRYGTVSGDFSEIKQLRSSASPRDLSLASIAETPEGNVLLVHSSAPLEIMMLNPGPIRFVSLPPGGRSNTLVRTFAMASDPSKVWVGSDNGLYLYDLQKGEFLPFSNPLLNDVAVNTLARSGDIVWIGTKDQGLYRLNTVSGETRHYTYDENVPYSLVSNRINHVGISREGDVLVLTNWGVCRYDPANDNFPQLTEIGQNIRANSMVEESDGTIWIGTENYGYFRKKPGAPRFERVTDTSEHPSPQVPKFSFEMSRFGVYNSMRPGAVQLADGLTAMGAHNGFLIIDPSKLNDSERYTVAYPGTITFPFMEDSSAELEALGLMAPLFTRDKVEIPYRDNTFTIQFSGIHPLSDPDVKFDYMLRGFDKDWIVASSLPEVTYSNVPSGEYEFLIRPHGMTNPQVRTVKIKILPPWYLSTMAFVVYIILALLLGWGIYKLGRILVVRNFQKKVKEMEARQERETFEAKTRYFVDLVHEIRTPLMLISMPLEQLADEVADTSTESQGQGRQQKYVKSMQTNVDYLLGITNQLLDFRKAEKQSEVRLNVSRFDIRQILLSMAKRFEEPMRLSAKQLECIVPDTPVWVKGDLDKIERVLMNLMGNAMKYAETRITMELRDNGGEEVIISITDDGIGIPEEEKKKVFDTYYQIHNDTKSMSLGTGLGLAYARMIAEAHKGAINISDNPDGSGAVFTLTLPKDCGEAERKVESLTGIAYDPEAAAPEKKDITVLLVEDNDDLRGMISDTLGKYYNVITASDGDVALELLKEKMVDVVVSDVMMQRMDGIELCRRVKGDIEFSHIPFIILSALTASDAKEKGLECGADVYLEKPFPMRQLVMQIENILRTRSLFHERMKTDMNVTPEESSPETDSAPQPTLNRMDAEFFEKMNAIISEAMEDEEFSIDVLAQNLHMSRSSFYRKVTAVTGMSPNDYLKNFRLGRAAELLKEGYRISEVAERVGFTSSSYFAKCFRAKYGVLPSEYSGER